MKYKLSIAIMAHPSREAFIPYLKEKLGDIPVSYDRGEGIWQNRKRASLMYDRQATHHLVVQDDAIIGRGFLERVMKEIEGHPNTAINLYWGRRVGLLPTADAGLKDGGVLSRWIHWGVAIILPTKLIEPMIEYCDQMEILHNHDDTRIGHFLRSKGVSVWYPLPSLVDHREEMSIMENKEGSARRTALYFVGE